MKLFKTIAIAAILVASTINSFAEEPAVAAASDLKFALDKISGLFKEKTGKAMKITYGSSGNLTQQINEGAPFQLFFSANEGFVKKLEKAGKTVDGGDLYAEGRIVLFAPKDSPIKVDGELKDVRAALKDGRLKKMAIANPEHAPYGMAAKQALEHEDLWTVLEGKLVLGENVSQAAQFATTGSTEAGIFAYSLALAQEVSKLGDYVLIPTDWHKPLLQRMVRIKGADQTADEFYNFMKQPEARKIMIDYGFVLPGEK